MLAIYGDPLVVRYVDTGIPLSRELCVRWIEVSQRNYRTRGYGASAVIEKCSGQFVGCIGLIHAPDRTFVEIIYGFLQSAWGRGFASEVVPAMLEYGFERLGLPEIYASISPENLPSARILEKSGMRVLEREDNPDGSVTVVYRLLPGELTRRSSSA
jgi:RimJ/RimL family protein N-acetyltransferase